MDINTIKVISDGLNTKKTKIDKLEEKKQDKKDVIKGCLKLVDYMAF